MKTEKITLCAGFAVLVAATLVVAAAGFWLSIGALYVGNVNNFLDFFDVIGAIGFTVASWSIAFMVTESREFLDLVKA